MPKLIKKNWIGEKSYEIEQLYIGKITIVDRYTFNYFFSYYFFIMYRLITIRDYYTTYNCYHNLATLRERGLVYFEELRMYSTKYNDVIILLF